MAMQNFDMARKNMVEGQIMPAGVVRADVLDRFLCVPREDFVPVNLRGYACLDSDVSVDTERFLSPPALHARMIDAASPCESDVVLDVGGGTGYGAAVLSGLVGSVVALESSQDRLDRAQALWRSLACRNVTGVRGDLRLGYPERAPYTLIFINGAVAEPPPRLLEQLFPGGRLVAVVRETDTTPGRVVMVRRGGGDTWSSRDLFDASCPWIPEFAPAGRFVF